MFWILRLQREDVGRRLALEQALERNNFLMREIHHRVKNNLQAVSSLMRLQPLPQDRKDDLARRIATMVAVHEHIYGSDQFEEVEVAAYVERIVKNAAEGFRGDVTIQTEIEPLTLGSGRAMPTAPAPALAEAELRSVSLRSPSLRPASAKAEEGNGDSG